MSDRRDSAEEKAAKQAQTFLDTKEISLTLKPAWRNKYQKASRQERNSGASFQIMK